MPFSAAIRSHRPWRTWLAAYLFLALVWPATGALPWIAIDFGHRFADGTVADDEDGERGLGSAHEAADVPGSPTHPLGHHCPQCEILKHLARCVLPDACKPSVAPASGRTVLPSIATEWRHASFVALRPPIRAPPSLAV